MVIPVKPVTPCYTKLDWCINKASMHFQDMIVKSFIKAKLNLIESLSCQKNK